MPLETEKTQMGDSDDTVQGNLTMDDSCWSQRLEAYAYDFSTVDIKQTYVRN